MTVEQAKKEFVIMNVIVKRLIDLTDDQRKRVIDFFLTMYAENATDDAKEEIKAISFCVGKLDQIGKREGQAIVKFLVDRFMPDRFEVARNIVDCLPVASEL